LKFYIGDVRDYDSVENAVIGVDYIFHAAALKQVPTCEFYPMEAVKTNVLGTYNVVSAAKRNKVKKLVCLSTDKAAYPINAMGISKAMMEKVFTSESRNTDGLTICGTRYGNVMASRGSVIPLFVEQIANDRPITITNKYMTRYMMTLEDAVDLVIYAFQNGSNGDLFVQKSPAATIEVLIEAILRLKNLDGYPVKSIGVRHGEKLYETLLTSEEFSIAKDLGDYYVVNRDNRDLNYEKFFSDGDSNSDLEQDYNSHNTTRLDVTGMCELLVKLKEFQK